MTLGGSRTSLGLSFSICQGVAADAPLLLSPSILLGFARDALGLAKLGRYLWSQCPEAENLDSFIYSLNVY